jgi:hypothetical protein
VENILSLAAYLRSTNASTPDSATARTSLNFSSSQSSRLSTLGPPFAFSLWVAARVLLVHGSTIANSVNPRIGELVTTLRHMGKYWRVADRYASLLTRVLDEYEASQQTPSLDEHGEKVTPSTVRILADMRRCAFDLDFLISRQPKLGIVGNANSHAAHNGTNPTVNGLMIGGATTAERSKYPSLTPVRTPQPVDFEYLDVFDFFNMPRLPLGVDSSFPGHELSGSTMEGYSNGNDANDKHSDGGSQKQNGKNEGGKAKGMETEIGGAGVVEGNGLLGGNGGNEFNITNFSFDANSDWFGKSA